MFDTDFLPLITFLVEVVNVKSIEVTQHHNIPIGTSSTNCEFFTLFITCVIESLHQVSVVVIERDFLITSTSEYMNSKCQSVRDTVMYAEFLVLLLIDVVNHH